MAALYSTRTNYGSHGLASRISSTLAFVTGAVVSWNDARLTRKQLASLTDRELDDIGLVRGDIDSVATGKPRT